MWRFGGNGLGYYIFTPAISLTCHAWCGSETLDSGSDTWSAGSDTCSVGSDTCWGWIEYRQPGSDTICVDRIRVCGVDRIRRVFCPFQIRSSSLPPWLLGFMLFGFFFCAGGGRTRQCKGFKRWSCTGSKA